MKRNLTKDLFNRKDFFLEIIAVIVIVLLVIIFRLLPSKIIGDIENSLINFVTNDRISLITNVSAIFIGAYINVLIVISTSKLSMSQLILKNKMDQRILGVIIVGIIEDFLLILMPFFFYKHYIFVIVYIGVVTLALISFIKFIKTSLLLFHININQMIKEIDDETEYKSNLMILNEEELNILRQLNKSSQNRN